jgi:hypothetical protein
MPTLDPAADSAVHAMSLVAARGAAVHPTALVVGTVLYLAAKAVRTRAWFSILRAAFPEATGLRPRDVMRAYLAGSGINVIVPARGGDVVKLAMLRRRIEGSRYPTLAATLVPETLFETALGIGLVLWALASGFLPVPTVSGRRPAHDVALALGHPVLAALGAAAALAAGWWLARRLRTPLRHGTAILRSPWRFVTGVASWQALARLIRLGAIAAFMAAFGLPLTPATALLVMAAQGAGRVLLVEPVSAGLRVAMLSYGFVAITGHSVDIAAITAFTFGAAAVQGTAGLATALTILAVECETWSPRRALAMARTWGPASARPDHDGAAEPAIVAAVRQRRAGRRDAGRLLRPRTPRRARPAPAD